MIVTIRLHIASIESVGPQPPGTVPAGASDNLSAFVREQKNLGHPMRLAMRWITIATPKGVLTLALV